MSAVSILAPVIVAAWKEFDAAVMTAAASLGFAVETELAPPQPSVEESWRTVDLSIENSTLVTTRLGRDRQLVVSRDDVTVVFSRNARGKASLCVTGRGHTDDALRSIGEELSGRVVQHYVYQRLMAELRARHFNIVAEETDENNAIHMRVRHWDT